MILSTQRLNRYLRKQQSKNYKRIEEKYLDPILRGTIPLEAVPRSVFWNPEYTDLLCIYALRYAQAISPKRLLQTWYCIESEVDLAKSLKSEKYRPFIASAERYLQSHKDVYWEAIEKELKRLETD